VCLPDETCLSGGEKKREFQRVRTYQKRFLRTNLTGGKLAGGVAQRWEESSDGGEKSSVQILKKGFLGENGSEGRGPLSEGGKDGRGLSKGAYREKRGGGKTPRRQ